MSESDYYRELSEKKSKNKRSAVTALESESEEERASSPKNKKVAVKKTTKKTSGHKKQISVSTSSSSLMGDLFGTDDETPQVLQQPLWSSLTRRVANGTLRQAEQLEGEFFVEVRVFNSEEIRNLHYSKRNDEVSAVLRLQLDNNDPQWSLIKKLFAEAKKKFQKEAVFYQKEKK